VSRARHIAGRLAAVALIMWVAIAVLASQAAVAHEVRPAYLQVTETGDGAFDVLFKTPMRGDLRLALDVGFSGNAGTTTPVVSRVADGAVVQTWQMRGAGSLAGREVRIDGLAKTLTDALVRIEFADGRSWVQRLTPSQPQATIPAAPSGWQVAKTYLLLGIEHILIGIDHLLFVLALVLLTRGARQLVGAVTAFTLAHSITLAAATLGLVHVPSKPVEAAIALSIVFVAVEIINARAGKAALAARMPWLVALGFGLLHGFGFAGALSEIGMPEGQIPVALLFFNLGVEAGQLLFVGTVLGFVALVRVSRIALPRWSTLAVPYLIGTVAMSWVIQRIAAF
jgi:hydrogenase/urease accessory protein HupE